MIHHVKILFNKKKRRRENLSRSAQFLPRKKKLPGRVSFMLFRTHPSPRYRILHNRRMRIYYIRSHCSLSLSLVEWVVDGWTTHIVDTPAPNLMVIPIHIVYTVQNHHV